MNDELLEGESYPNDLTVGRYSFLVVAAPPFILDKIQKKQCSHIIEYGFTALQWENSAISMGVCRKDFSIFIATKNDIFNPIYSIIKLNSYDEEETLNKKFMFLYFITDDTCLNVKCAYGIKSAYLMCKEEVLFFGGYRTNLKFTGTPVISEDINKSAKDFLASINKDTLFK